MNELGHLVQTATKFRADTLKITYRVVGHIAEVFLRLNNRVEIPAIGDIHSDQAEIGTVDLDIGFVKEGWHIGQFDRFHVIANLFIFGNHKTGWCFKAQHARGLRLYQTFLNRHGDSSDRAMTTHRQAAGCFDKQDGNVTIVARRFIKDRARHDVMAARLEHQPGPDPVIFRQKMRPFFEHVCTFKLWSAACNHTHRIAAGMSINTEETVFCHLVRPYPWKRSIRYGVMLMGAVASLTKSAISRPVVAAMVRPR